MKRLCQLLFSTILLVSVVSLTLAPDTAFAKSTSDPNHKGYSGKHPRSKQLDWKPIEAKCEKCKQMVEQYNAIMSQLLKSRYWLSFWRQIDKNREDGKKDPFWPGKGDISEFEARAVGLNLELFDLQNAQLELHRKLVRSLEQQASYLRAAIIECETTACGKAKKPRIKDIKIGGESATQPWQPDTDAILKQYGVKWQGPYATNCLPCQPIATQLNAVPGWIVRAHFKLQLAEQQLAYAELIAKSNKIKLDFIEYHHPDKTDYSGLKNKVATYKAELTALKKYFEKLLKDLAVCETKYCQVSKDEDASYGNNSIGLGDIGLPDICDSPAAHDSINVGPNSEVGSSANFKEKAKKKITGAAIGAVANLIGLGGGGRSKSDGPPTYKDPIKKKQKTRVRDKKAKRDFYAGASFTEDGLLISSDIKKAPGKGTFHTIYLENAGGWRLMPIALFMYEIWRDWKLSVSWTRDTFVDGELVKHEEGGWTESWRELIARGEEVIYGEVFTAPIWEQLGFTTAVSGARSLGTLFPVSPQMLANEEWNLVVHVSDPRQDPVMTVPYIFDIAMGDKGRVQLTQVDNTVAHQSNDCDELKTQLANAETADIDKDYESPYTNEVVIGTDRELVPQVLAGALGSYLNNQQQVIDDLIAPEATVSAGTQELWNEIVNDLDKLNLDRFSYATGDVQIFNLVKEGDLGGIDTALSIFLDDPRPALNNLAPEPVVSGTVTTSTTVNTPERTIGPNEEIKAFEVSTESSLLESSPLSEVIFNIGTREDRLSSFVLTFSEPMDTATVEDNFIVRAFRNDASASDEPGDPPHSTVDVWDDKAFDVEWNDNATQATFAPTNVKSTDDPEEVNRRVVATLNGVLTGGEISELTVYNPAFERLRRLEQAAETYMGNFDLVAKRETLQDLKALKDELIASGESPESTAVNEVDATIIELGRQITSGQREYEFRRMKFEKELLEVAESLPSGASGISLGTLPPEYVSYVKLVESLERSASADPTYVHSVTSEIGGLQGSQVISNREARKVINKYRKWVSGGQRFHSVLNDIDLNSARLLSQSVKDGTIKTLSEKNNEAPSVSVYCPGEYKWEFGVYSDADVTGFTYSLEDEAPLNSFAECEVKTQMKRDQLQITDYFSAADFNITTLPDGQQVLELKPDADASSAAFSIFNAEEETEAFADRDGDGIEDSIDTQPDEFSDEFEQQSDGLVVGKIINRNGNTVKVIDNGGEGVTIESGSETENSSDVEILGVELEIRPGTIFEASFG